MPPTPPAELTPTARLVLACLREHPDLDTPRAMADGPLGRLLAVESVHTALVELRAHGLGREAKGRWHLTSLGHAVRDGAGRRRSHCTVTSERRGTVMSVAVTGRLGGSGVRSLREELTSAAALGPEIVLLDLSDVTAIDPEGVEAIVAVDGLGRRTGSRLVVVPGPDNVQEAFARAGLLERLTVVTSVKAAA